MKAYVLGVLGSVLLSLGASEFRSATGVKVENGAATGPSLLSANCVDGLNLEMLFDRPLDPAAAASPAAYSVQVDSFQNPVSSAQLMADSTTVLVRMDQQLFAGNATLVVNGIRGADGSFAQGTYPYIRVDDQVPVHIGQPADDLFARGALETVRPGRFAFTLNSGLLGGVADDCLFVGKPVGTNSFLYDGSLRPATATGTNASAGIMVRASAAANSAFYGVFVTGSTAPAPAALRIRAFYRLSSGAPVIEVPHSDAFPLDVPVSEIRVFILRSGGDIGISWSASPADSSHRLPEMQTICALSAAVLVGPVAAFLDSTAAVPTHFEILGDLTSGDDFPPPMQVATEGGLIKFWWSGAGYVAVTGSLESPISSWKPVPIWPVYTNYQSILRVKVTQNTQFFAIRRPR